MSVNNFNIWFFLIKENNVKVNGINYKDYWYNKIRLLTVWFVT